MRFGGERETNFARHVMGIPPRVSPSYEAVSANFYSLDGMISMFLRITRTKAPARFFIKPQDCYHHSHRSSDPGPDPLWHWREATLMSSIILVMLFYVRKTFSKLRPKFSLAR